MQVLLNNKWRAVQDSQTGRPSAGGKWQRQLFFCIHNQQVKLAAIAAATYEIASTAFMLNS
jgi:hypothetical protein